jgi:hypothetical protein
LLVAPSFSYAHHTRYAFAHFLFSVLCWFVKQEKEEKENKKRWRTKQKNKRKRKRNENSKN